MMISTRGRYALRVMIDLAENGQGRHISMKEVTARQDISPKYMEKIMPLLVADNLVEGIHGKGGGYKLTRSPEEYTVGEILRLTEGGLAPVSCLECGAEECSNIDDCRTIGMWTELYNTINNFLDGVTLADLMRNPDLAK